LQSGLRLLDLKRRLSAQEETRLNVRPRLNADRPSFVSLSSLVLLAPLLLLATSLPAQSLVLDITHIHSPRFLDSTWLVQSGDNPAYANPAFDDAHWIPFDPYSNINAIYGDRRPNVLWYRLHVNVDPADKELALSEWQIARAFQVYVNGEQLIASGQINPFRPYTLIARPVARIPQPMVQTGSLVVALRVHVSPAEWGNGQNAGYYANNLSIGDYDTLVHDNWLTIIGEDTFRWLDRFLLICLGLVALVLFSAQRSQKQYLWIAALAAVTLLQTPEPMVAAFRNIPSYWEFINGISHFASPFVWAGLYFSFAHQRIGWRWSAYLTLAGIGSALSAVQSLVFTGNSPLLFFINFPFIILLSVIVPIVLAIHWRRGNREAGILLISVVLFSLYIYTEVSLGVLFRIPAWKQFAIRGLTLMDSYPAGPFRISLDNISGILCTLSLAIIILLRSTTISRRQAVLESELEAAQQVQQVLVPEQIGEVPGFAVESVYLPAQQVGGDFFQIVPDGRGGLLVVVGDVAGKGLPAAMLVSVLVGAIRATAEFTCNPALFLSNLNDRLVGRAGGGFSTALVAHIADDGLVSIANAGHLSPYLDGKEVDLPGALPLGVAAGATYDVTEFAFDPGSRLTFYSDGVVEAQNAKGELLGFDRSRELSLQSATDIAAAARNFGQQDDITVLTIQRIAVPAIIA
jgi:sigma-B regulation protein RsbU (phosphoserine phosphatase)